MAVAVEPSVFLVIAIGAATRCHLIEFDGQRGNRRKS
jgi:hypothetical protein